MTNRNIDQRNQHWDKILVWVGPLSWPVMAIYVLISSREMWGGLIALYIAIPISLAIHVIAPLTLIILVFYRRRRGQRIGKMIRWGLLYYALIPLIIFAILLWTQGISGTLALGGEMTRMIREVIRSVSSRNL